MIISERCEIRVSQAIRRESQTREYHCRAAKATLRRHYSVHCTDLRPRGKKWRKIDTHARTVVPLVSRPDKSRLFSGANILGNDWKSSQAPDAIEEDNPNTLVDIVWLLIVKCPKADTLHSTTDESEKSTKAGEAFTLERVEPQNFLPSKLTFLLSYEYQGCSAYWESLVPTIPYIFSILFYCYVIHLPPHMLHPYIGL